MNHEHQRFKSSHLQFIRFFIILKTTKSWYFNFGFQTHNSLEQTGVKCWESWDKAKCWLCTGPDFSTRIGVKCQAFKGWLKPENNPSVQSWPKGQYWSTCIYKAGCPGVYHSVFCFSSSNSPSHNEVLCKLWKKI